MARNPLVRFAPFFLVVAVHLIGLLLNNFVFTHVTKPLIMLTLLLALVLTVGRPRGESGALAVAAVLFSFVGDVLLQIPGDLWFLFGLGGFLLAHVTYLLLFARGLRRRRVPLVALVLVVWWVGLLVVLAPSLGVMLVPVALYGLALAGSTSVALACNRYIAIGGLAFLASDTILAFKMFYPSFALWQADFVIMVLYCAAQGLIVLGVTRELVPARPVREHAVV